MRGRRRKAVEGLCGGGRVDGSAFREKFSENGLCSPHPRGAHLRGGIRPLGGGPPPHARGWSRGRPPGRARRSLLPARAGMVPNARRLKSTDLADDEFLTYEGKVMTREEINAQHTCANT